MVAHPIAVRSEILNNASSFPLAVSSEAFARNALQDLGLDSWTCGSWTHEAIVRLMRAVPLGAVQWWFSVSVGFFSRVLRRDIDTRPVELKVVSSSSSSS